jgi:hypothetical protein
VISCAPLDSPGASRRQPLPTFNFHRARVRRAGGLLQVALSKARQSALPCHPLRRKRASDKALTQLDHLQTIFGIIAIIFVVKSCVSIAEL